MKQTKIIATIGPASESRDTLVAMSQAGANIARINCSHFDYDEFVHKVTTIH
jgi:pyruvate kinase